MLYVQCTYEPNYMLNYCRNLHLYHIYSISLSYLYHVNLSAPTHVINFAVSYNLNSNSHLYPFFALFNQTPCRFQQKNSLILQEKGVPVYSQHFCIILYPNNSFLQMIKDQAIAMEKANILFYYHCCLLKHTLDCLFIWYIPVV